MSGHHLLYTGDHLLRRPEARVDYLLTVASDKHKPTKTSIPKTRRFPRLVEGQEAAAIELLSRIVPRFEARLNKADNPASTELVFAIPLPLELRESYPVLFDLICGPRATDWEDAIAEGFRNTEYNGKPLSDFIAPQLRRAFAAGIRAWLKAIWDGENPDIERLERELLDFDKLTKMKSGPQSDSRAALWVAKRLDQLVTGIKAIRFRCKDRSRIGTRELKLEIEKLCSYEIYKTALGKLLSNETEITPWIILTPEINVQEIALVVIAAELPTSGHDVDINKTSLRTLVKMGRKLVESLGHVPQPRS
jgi:hypothetical protein